MDLPPIRFAQVLHCCGLLGTAFLSGCSAVSASHPSPPPSPQLAPISVVVKPASATVPVSETQQFNAVLQNDSQNKGVTWSLTDSGAGCSPGCGVLLSIGSSTVTYSAPATMPQDPSATLTAVSVADATKSSSVQISITASGANPGISVSLSPDLVSLSTSQNQQFTAVVQNDPQNEGVTWSLSQSGTACSPECGSLVGFTTQSAIYAAPSAPPNSPAVTLTATSVADNTQSASATISVSSSGPADPGQWVDITKFGARSVDRAPTATAKCIAGSTLVSLSNGPWPQDFTKFQTGDSVRLDHCGPPTKMTPPTNVAVSPGMNAGGTPAVSGLSPGTTSYTYQVIACDKFGGCSAASQISGTSSGSPTLGRVTATISRMSLSNNLMTVTTTGAHGFAPHALVYIAYFSTQTASFEGWYIVNTVPTANTFTFLTSLDSRIGGTPTLDTSGGTAVAFNCNVVSWDSEPDAWKYYIFGRTPGSMTLIGVAEPGITSWQDYGSPIMDKFSFPSFVPATPPATSGNQYLLTTITGGAGTPSIVVADPAANTVGDVPALMGSDAAILAAAKAAMHSTLYIPNGTFAIAGYLDLGAVGPIYVKQAGTLLVADTVQITSGMYWQGWGPGPPTQFQETPTPLIWGMPGSYPTIYFHGGGTLQFDHLHLRDQSNGQLLFYADSGVALNFDYVQFDAGGGTYSGYMNRHMILRTGGFDYNFSKCLFIADQQPSGAITDIGYSFLPSVLFVPRGSTPSGNVHFRDTWFVGKSAVEVNQSNPGSSGGASYNVFENTQTQNMALPIFIASNYPNVNTWANASASFDGVSPADYPSAITGNWATNHMTVSIQNLSNLPKGSRPLVVGNPTQLLGSDGGTAAAGAGGGWFAGGGSQVGYLLPPPAAAPVLTVSAGGEVPPGNHAYQVAWIDAFGNSTTLGPSAAVNIVAGMQTVTVTAPAAPPGAVSWQFYRDGALAGPSSGCGPYELGTSQTDATSFNCGRSAPPQNTAMSSGVGMSGTETTQIQLTGGGHKTVISGTFSANRTLKVPDVSGTIAVKIASGTVMIPTDAIDPAACSTVISIPASGVLPTDVVGFSPSSKPQTEMSGLRIHHWASTDSVNFQFCNETTVSIKPDPATLNWQVVR